MNKSSKIEDSLNKIFSTTGYKMVDVSSKEITHRKALAVGEIILNSKVIEMIKSKKMPKKGSCLGVTWSTYASYFDTWLVPKSCLCPKDQESSPFVYTYLQPVKRYSRKTSKKSIFFVAFLADFGQIAKVFVRF